MLTHIQTFLIMTILEVNVLSVLECGKFSHCVSRRGKRSVSINLRDERGRQVLKRLSTQVSSISLNALVDCLRILTLLVV